MSFNLKAAIGSIAPTLATMLGGPLAGTAVAALAQAFGLSPTASQSDITQVAATGMTPETIAAIRKADQEHAEHLQQMQIDVEKLNADHQAAIAQIDASDRDSARKREMTIRGATTPALAWTVVIASVIMGVAVVTGSVSKDPAYATLIGTVIGYIFSEAKQVLAYYFGSSVGSVEKTALLAKAPAIPPEQ